MLTPDEYRTTVSLARIWRDTPTEDRTDKVVNYLLKVLKDTKASSTSVKFCKMILGLKSPKTRGEKNTLALIMAAAS